MLRLKALGLVLARRRKAVGDPSGKKQLEAVGEETDVVVAAPSGELRGTFDESGSKWAPGFSKILSAFACRRRHGRDAKLPTGAQQIISRRFRVCGVVLARVLDGHAAERLIEMRVRPGS